MDTNLNSDQTFTLVRQMMTVLGALMLGALEPALQNLIIGGVPVIVSVAWSLWRNADNAYDMVFAGMRQAILLVGAYAVAKGWVSNEQIQYLSGSVIAILSSVMSFWFYRNKPGPHLPGTTIVDPK